VLEVAHQLSHFFFLLGQRPLQPVDLAHVLRLRRAVLEIEGQLFSVLGE
jgi:hypothetical protein